MNDEVILPSE